MKAYEVGGTYETHKRDEKCIQSFGRKIGKEETILEALDVDEMMMLTCFLNTYDGRVFTGLPWAAVGFSSGVLSCDTAINLLAS
jgi:hypothetical protein